MEEAEEFIHVNTARRLM